MTYGYGKPTKNDHSGTVYSQLNIFITVGLTILRYQGSKCFHKHLEYWTSKSKSCIQVPFSADAEEGFTQAAISKKLICQLKNSFAQACSLIEAKLVGHLDQNVYCR